MTDRRQGTANRQLVWPGFLTFVRRNQSEILKRQVSRFFILATNNCFHKTPWQPVPVWIKDEGDFSQALPQGQRARVGERARCPVRSHQTQAARARQGLGTQRLSTQPPRPF